MKRTILSFILIALSLVAFSGESTLTGIYQGKNIFVMNPFSSSGVGFCVYEVRVNDQVTTDEINSSAFEIDLSLYQFKIGDKLIVTIKYKANCLPKVINPEVLMAKSTFNISIIKVNRDNTLEWTTTGESGALPFVVEQFRWNKWVKVETVQGKGTPGTNAYSVQVHPHSGNNEFRVKQVDYTKIARYSRTARYRSLDPPVTFSPTKGIQGEITFSAETMYEIYNPYGNLVLKGFGSKVDVSSLKKLDKYEYILHFDNQVARFNKN